jgi:hypothetical protein
MPDYRLRARSAVPGAYNFKAGRLAFLAAAADVWNGVGRGDGTNGTKRASSIANCAAANVKLAVVIDDVTGTYSGVSDLPDIGNVLDTDTLDLVPGTYHPAAVGEVKYGVVFGPASALTGIYGQSAVGDEASIEPLRQAIMTRFTIVSNDLYNDVGGRLFFGDAPEGTNLSDGPYAIFFFVSDVDEDTFTENMQEVYVQFSLFSGESSPTTIIGMDGHLSALFKDQSFVVAGWTMVIMKRVNGSGAINVPADTEAGTGRYWQFDTDFTVTLNRN